MAHWTVVGVDEVTEVSTMLGATAGVVPCLKLKLEIREDAASALPLLVMQCSVPVTHVDSEVDAYLDSLAAYEVAQRSKSDLALSFMGRSKSV
jgi:hypothetical protein